MMLGLVRALRPVSRLSLYRSFCTKNHTQRIKDMHQVFRVHSQNLSDSKKFLQKFNSEYLLGLVEQNYCFSDLVDICNSLIYHKEGQKVDHQVIFLAYSYNLYYTELRQGSQLLRFIIDALNYKILAQKFQFSSPIIEKLFLMNIKSLTNRQNVYLSQQTTLLRKTFFDFLLLKFQLKEDSGQYKPVTAKTLEQLVAVKPYIPKENILYNINHLEKYYNLVVKEEVKWLLQKSDSPQHDIKESISRFTMLMQVGVIIGKRKQRFLNIFPSLPTKFTTETQFITFIRVLREFFTYQMLHRLGYSELDQYNEALSINNISYRSPAAVRAFEDYIQSLLLLKKNNLLAFNAYLGYEDHKLEYRNKYEDEFKDRGQGEEWKASKKGYGKSEREKKRRGPDLFPKDE